MKIRHISDLHFGGGDRQLRGLNDLINHLATQERGVIAITGDVVDGRNPNEWQRVLPYLRHLQTQGFKLLVVPGNHCCSNNLGVTFDLDACDRSWKAINDLCDVKLSKAGPRTWNIDGIKFIGLDSCLGNADDISPPLARGELGRSQIAWLEVELQDVLPTFILMHHKPHSKDFAHLLEDRQDFLNIIYRRDHVRAVLFGHIHKWSIFDQSGIRFFESDNTTISRRYRLIDTDDLTWKEIKF